jgi:hypothetical protein
MLKHRYQQQKSYTGWYTAPNTDIFQTVLADWKCENCQEKILGYPDNKGKPDESLGECKEKPAPQKVELNRKLRRQLQGEEKTKEQSERR